MKISNLARLAFVMIFISAVIPDVSGQWSVQQKKDIVKIADSILIRYNRFGTFSEEYGYFSVHAADEYMKLFSENGMLVNDLQKGKYEIVTIKRYVELAKTHFTRGLEDATFERNADFNTITFDFKNKTIKVPGIKNIKATLKQNGRTEAFVQNLTDFQIVFSVSADLKKIEISGTELINHVSANNPTNTEKVKKENENETPVQAVSKSYSEINLQVVDAEELPLLAMVTLTLDGEIFAKQETNDSGKLTIDEIPKFNKFNLVVTSLADKSLTKSLDGNSNDFKSISKITLKKSEKIKVTFQVSNTRGHIVPGASVTLMTANETFTETADRNGRVELSAYPGTKVTIIAKAIRHKEVTKEYITSSKKDKYSDPAIILAYIEEEQNIQARLNAGIFRSADLKNRFIDDLVTDPSFGIDFNYQRYPYKANAGNFDLGYYGSLGLNYYSFSITDSKYAGEYQDSYIDAEGDTAILILNSDAVSEDHTFFTLGLSGGIIIRERFETVQGLHFSVSIGPELVIIPYSSNNYSTSSMQFSGRYPAYFNVELRNITRYGFISKEFSGTTDECFQPIAFGVKAGLNADYKINKNLSLTAGIKYNQIFTSLLKTQETRQVAELSLDIDNTPIHSYNGLLNDLKSFKFSNYALAIGLIYKLK